MSVSAKLLSPSEAASRLGVSAKALRLYERRGLVVPARSAAGWRVYGPDHMARAAEVVALRALGLSLAQVARVLGGDAQDLEPALAQHQAFLENEARGRSTLARRVRELRDDLARGKTPAAGELARLVRPAGAITVAFDLPWPWGGERFELHDMRALTYIIGPLGSGKTRLAMRLAETIDGAAFLGLDRSAARLASDPDLKTKVDRTLAWLLEDGAVASEALVALLAGLEAEGPAVLVVDMIEQGLDQTTQETLIGYLRRRAPGSRPIFLMTRSSAILDLDAVGPDEAILFCPANHSPPILVAAVSGAPGYEAVATCLASPEVRARTEGVVAWKPEVA